MAEDTTTNTSPSPKPPVTSLAELQKLCLQRKKVEFTLDGSPCVLEVRRLTPAEEFKVAEIIESIIPPVVKGKTPEEDRLDIMNPAYQKSKMEASMRARALALYWAVPAFNEGKPGLTNVSEITEYIQGQLTEAVLNILWQGVKQSGVNLAELVNFS